MRVFGVPGGRSFPKYSQGPPPPRAGRMADARRPEESFVRPPCLLSYRPVLRDCDEARRTGRGGALSPTGRPRPVSVQSVPRCCASWRRLDAAFSASSVHVGLGFDLAVSAAESGRLLPKEGSFRSGSPAARWHNARQSTSTQRCLHRGRCCRSAVVGGVSWKFFQIPFTVGDQHWPS